jgi:hypothetical protein
MQGFRSSEDKKRSQFIRRTLKPAVGEVRKKYGDQLSDGELREACEREIRVLVPVKLGRPMNLTTKHALQAVLAGRDINEAITSPWPKGIGPKPEDPGDRFSWDCGCKSIMTSVNRELRKVHRGKKERPVPSTNNQGNSCNEKS